jgi:hypothetical protein
MIRQFAYHGEVSDQVLKLEFGFHATHLDIFNDWAADLSVCFSGDDTVKCRLCQFVDLMADGFIVKKDEHRNFGMAPGTNFVCVKTDYGKTTKIRVEAYHF